MSSTAEPQARSQSQSHSLNHQAKEDRSSDGEMLFALLVSAFGSVGSSSISRLETRGLTFGAGTERQEPDASLPLKPTPGSLKGTFFWGEALLTFIYNLSAVADRSCTRDVFWASFSLDSWCRSLTAWFCMLLSVLFTQHKSSKVC